VLLVTVNMCTPSSKHSWRDDAALHACRAIAGEELPEAVKKTSFTADLGHSSSSRAPAGGSCTAQQSLRLGW